MSAPKVPGRNEPLRGARAAPNRSPQRPPHDVDHFVDVLVGLATLFASYLLMLTLGTDTGALAYLATMLPVGLGMGIFQSPNNSAIMGSVPPRRLGVTSGLLTITRITGQLSGISILGAVWASRVAAHAGVRGEPSAAPPEAQVSGLHETMLVSAGLIAVSLAVAVWGRWRGGADESAYS